MRCRMSARLSFPGYALPLSKLFVVTLFTAIISICPVSVVSAASVNSKSVEAKNLESIAVYPQYNAPATVVALNDSELSAEINAIVESIPVEVGQQVKKGELLVSLRRKDYQLILQQEEAELATLETRIDFAQYQLQRAQTLIKQQAVSEELLKQRETDLAVLQAEKKSRQVSLQKAKRNLAKSNIRSPFDAVIIEKIASVGELASPGTPLMRIVDARGREVAAKLQSYQIASLHAATQMFFQDRNSTYPVKLRSVLPVIDSMARTQEVRLVFNGEKALVGVSGELIWKNRQPHVPAEVLVQRGGRLGVFIVNGKKQAQFMALENAAEGRPTFVDLPLNTLIVTKGRFQLQDGDTISIL
ncbi:efflux RND transporter periplasmic adaptor subunit [Kaarinaea lacus]